MESQSEKSEHPNTDEEKKDRKEDELCKSIIQGFARHHRKRNAILANAEEEEDQRVHARELELKYFPDLGVNERVDERETIAKNQVTPDDTKWIDTNKAFEEEPMQIKSRIAAREFKVEIDQICLWRLFPLEALKAIISFAAKSKSKHSQSCTLTRHVRAFTQRFRDLCCHVCLWRTERASSLEHWIVQEEHVRHTRDAASNLECDWQASTLQ